MKKRLICLVIALILALGCAMPAFAANSGFTFAITVNGKASATVKKGDSVTVALTVTNNAGTGYNMYTMQDYVHFDPSMFSIDESSIAVYADNSFRATAQDLGNGPERVYVNRTSITPSSVAKTVTVLTFTLTALKNGTATLTHSRIEMTDGENACPVTETNASVTVGGTDGGGSSKPGTGGTTDKDDDTDTPDVTTTLPFTDVEKSDWFYDDVAYVYGNGLMNGRSKALFAPYVSATRGMIVTVLYRMAGNPAVSGQCPFDDVAAGSYYEKAITWGAENGVVNGFGNGKFGPDTCITREQLAAILWRYAKEQGYDVSVGETTNILSYLDVATVHEYAVPAMQWACGAGLIQGSGGNLNPTVNARRCQVAAILHRFGKNVK